MPNYSDSRIIKIGNTKHYFFKASTLSIPQTMAELKRSYKKFKEDKTGSVPHRDYYDILNQLDLDKISAIEVESANLSTKGELNSLLERVIRADVRPLIQVSFETEEIYNSCFERLVAALGNNFYNDSKRVIQYLSSQRGFKEETIKQYLKSIIYVLKKNNITGDLLHTYQVLLQHYNLAISKTNDKQQKSQTQEENWIEHDKALQISEELANSGENYIISLFYSGQFFAPWRLELRELKQKDFDTSDDNYIDWEKKVFVLNKYKTFSSYGRIEQKIPAKLYNILLKWFKEHPVNTYVISDSKGSMFSQSNFTKRLTKIFGCSASLLRSSYATWLWQTGKLSTKEQNKKLALEMRHSIGENMTYVKVPAEAEAENEILDTEEYDEM